MKKSIGFARKAEYSIFWLRMSYWTGALAGFAVAFQMIFPGRPSLPSSLHLAGIFFFAWALLLIRAGRRPRDRKGILLWTQFPVLAVWAALQAALILLRIPLAACIRHWVIQGSLFLLFTFSCHQSRRAYSKWWPRRA